MLNIHKICHVIDDMGIGGAQTMMCELVNGLNKYYGNKCENHIFAKNINDCINQYSLKINTGSLADFLKENDINIVVQHRTNNSKCLRKHIGNSKYVLLNHTWNDLSKMDRFKHCDLYISVCQFLDSKTSWPSSANHISILNGLENDYIQSIPKKELEGKFKIGRCHRLLGNKFSVESIKWIGKNMPKDFVYYILGQNEEARLLSKKFSNIKYIGEVSDLNEKMSYIKSFDFYFYETFGNEGASMAILESLACGIPVLCSPFGGTSELIQHNTNGIFANNKFEYTTMIQYLYKAPNLSNSLKVKVVNDFDNRLHIKHSSNKYIQSFIDYGIFS